MPLRVVVAGIRGRMGRQLVAAAAEDPSVWIVAGITRQAVEDDNLGGRAARDVPEFNDVRRAAGVADVLIDFTAPPAAVEAAQSCAEIGLPMVSGTTGLSEDQCSELAAASQSIPLFYARNLSPGVAAISAAVQNLARSLRDYDVEIVEMHHRGKVDAPSGTALELAGLIADSRGARQGQAWTFGRNGTVSRRPGEIGLHAIRGGGNPGEHEIVFSGDGEEIRLSHRVYGRHAFALAALRAARFIAAPGRAAGWYGMTDLVATEVDDPPI